MKTTINHVLTEGQAERIDFPFLAGEIVRVELYRECEKPPELQGVPMAKNVYLGQERIAGNLHLEW